MTGLPTSLAPLAGGHSGRTFVGEVAGERAVVRIYPPEDPRGSEAPEVDRAVLMLVRGLLPVPDVLEVRRADETAGTPGLLVSTWMPGERGDVAVARLAGAGDEQGLARLGESMGTVAAILAGMPMRRPGPFIDAELTLGRFTEDALDEWVEARLPTWPADVRTSLTHVARDAQDLLDGVGRACLVHSDLNPKNVLVDPESHAVSAVLDWEYAHAGLPGVDLGNLLRLDRHPAYVEGVLAAYRERVPEAERGPDLLDRARAADLWALVDLAARAGQNPIATRAETLLLEIARTGDLHTFPIDL